MDSFFLPIPLLPSSLGDEVDRFLELGADGEERVETLPPDVMNIGVVIRVLASAGRRLLVIPILKHKCMPVEFLCNF